MCFIPQLVGSHDDRDLSPKDDDGDEEDARVHVVVEGEEPDVVIDNGKNLKTNSI